jgi:hypothetical protein
VIKSWKPRLECKSERSSLHTPGQEQQYRTIANPFSPSQTRRLEYRLDTSKHSRASSICAHTALMLFLRSIVRTEAICRENSCVEVSHSGVEARSFHTQRDGGKYLSMSSGSSIPLRKAYSLQSSVGCQSLRVETLLNFHFCLLGIRVILRLFVFVGHESLDTGGPPRPVRCSTRHCANHSGGPSTVTFLSCLLSPESTSSVNFSPKSVPNTTVIYSGMRTLRVWSADC